MVLRHARPPPPRSPSSTTTGDETGFTATTGSGWKPEPGSEDLTLTGSLTGSFTLKDTDGTTVTVRQGRRGRPTWQMTSAT